jgi:hypothetical protein
MKKIVILLCLLLLSFALVGCNEKEVSEGAVQDKPLLADVPDPIVVEPEVAWEWQYDSPQNHHLNGDILTQLHSEFDTTQVLAFVMIKDCYIVDEYYKEGYDETSIFPLHSCSKSVTSALIGIAIDQGYIEGVDTPISVYFPQILQSDNEYFKQITIRHLLTHTSGISSSDDAFGSSGEIRKIGWILYLTDLLQHSQAQISVILQEVRTYYLPFYSKQRAKQLMIMARQFYFPLLGWKVCNVEQIRKVFQMAAMDL